MTFINKIVRIHNRIPKINNKLIRKINPEVSYIKNKEIIKRKNSYETFKLLLSKNKLIPMEYYHLLNKSKKKVPDVFGN